MDESEEQSGPQKRRSFGSEGTQSQNKSPLTIRHNTSIRGRRGDSIMETHHPSGKIVAREEPKPSMD